MCEKLQCHICHNRIDNKVYEVKERQLNKGEIFSYLHCGKCGTLQLIDNVANIETYYPKGYPAFRTRENAEIGVAERLHRNLLLYLLLRMNIPQRDRNAILQSKYEYLNPLVGTHLHKKDSILDVGCGAGNWLCNLREEGFCNLTGVDLFTNGPKDRTGWKFISGDVYQSQLKKYDCITLHHSFEHMPNPLQVLKRIVSLLNQNGLCIIRIPVMESQAWDMFGTNWYQIDAPRHFYLYTVRAFKYLCRKAGMRVVKVLYDSEPIQFYYSKMYQQTDYDLKTIGKRLDKGRDTHVRMTQEANCNQKGDQAIFYLKKMKSNEQQIGEKR